MLNLILILCPNPIPHSRPPAAAAAVVVETVIGWGCKPRRVGLGRGEGKKREEKKKKREEYSVVGSTWVGIGGPRSSSEEGGKKGDRTPPVPNISIEAERKFG